MHLAVLFENIGGYHAARLRAAQTVCEAKGWRLTAIEITNAQGDHPWGQLPVGPRLEVQTVLGRADPRQPLSPGEIRRTGPATVRLLDTLQPNVVAIPGWGFPYSTAALRWCRRRDARAIVMSESKRDDEVRVWWKELIKRRWWVRHFDAGLVGARSHAEYLVQLGLDRDRIFFGYDVVDNDHFATAAEAARRDPSATRSRQPQIPSRRFFLAVTRFIGRKNILHLLRSYARYRAVAPDAWDLVICGSGPDEPCARAFIQEQRLLDAVHLPGFTTYDEIGAWYGLAGAFIHPALREQWGLVVNEAMAAGLPVLVSNRCGCFPELVREGITGFGFDPENVSELAELLSRCSSQSIDTQEVGRTAALHIRNFAPSHFGEGLANAAVCGARANLPS